jgi:uncharacterized protein YbjT (DUF2867 family)
MASTSPLRRRPLARGGSVDGCESGWLVGQRLGCDRHEVEHAALLAVIGYDHAELDGHDVGQRRVDKVRAGVRLRHAGGYHGDAAPGGDELEFLLDRGCSPLRRVEDRLTVEVRPSQRPAPSERVGCGQTGDLRLAADRDGPQPSVVERAPEVPDVGATVPQGRILLPPVQVEQFDLDVGVGRREGADCFGHVQPGREPDDESLDAPIDLVDAPDGGVDGREHLTCLLVKLLTRRRELHAAGRPYEERATELLLEGVDLPAENRLGNIELRGRPTEVPMLCHGGEVAKLAQVEIHARRVSILAQEVLDAHPVRPQDGPMIVITTPTGDIGSQVLTTLLESAPTSGEKFRVIVRDPSKLSDPVRNLVEVVVGSHRDGDVVDRAFVGADAVFWVVPPDPSASSLEVAYSGFTRSAAAAFTVHGVGHVVGVSALGRGTPVAGRAGLVTASLAMDDLIASTGVAYRALANPSFMDNLLRQVRSIRDQGVFTDTGTADRKVPTVATCDIAAAGAGLLLDRSWTGAGSVPVLGSEDLSPNDMAQIMSEVLAMPVRYEQQSLDDLGATLAGYGMGDAFVQGMVDMMRAKHEGLDDGVPRTPQTASPTTFWQWCERVLKPAVVA